MKTIEMKNMLRRYCIGRSCLQCSLHDVGLCGCWRSENSKTIRRAFHFLYPDYFQRRNENDKNESIVIWVEKNEVYAKRLSTGESGVARCSTKDEFNLLTGINLAVARMLGADKTNCSKE